MAENTNGITEAIIAKANEDAARINAAAEQYGQAKLAEAQKNCDDIMSCARKEARSACAFIRERNESACRIERKKAITKAKTDVVDAVFDGALDMLYKADEEKTLKFFALLIGKNAEEGDRLVLSARHAGIADKVAALPEIKSKKISVSADGTHDGGFILYGKNSDKDCSYGAIIEFCKQTESAQVAKRLFDEDGNE